jgi:hypothetical protein
MNQEYSARRQRAPESLQRLDRPSYWMRVLLICAGLGLLSIAKLSGVQLPPLDFVLILFLAVALAGRFRDIGWPAWIGASFPIATMVAFPVGVLLLRSCRAMSLWNFCGCRFGRAISQRR